MGSFMGQAVMLMENLHYLDISIYQIIKFNLINNIQTILYTLMGYIRIIILEETGLIILTHITVLSQWCTLQVLFAIKVLMNKMDKTLAWNSL
jgi:hypothetical protein